MAKKKRGGARLIVGSSPRSFVRQKKPLNSVGSRYLQFIPGSSWDSHMQENAVPWWSSALHDLRKAPECLHMTAKSWPGSVGASQSEECSATGNVKPRKPQGGFGYITWPFFLPIFVHICYRHTPVTLHNYEVWETLSSKVI